MEADLSHHAAARVPRVGAQAWRPAVRHALLLYCVHQLLFLLTAVVSALLIPRTPLERDLVLWPPAALAASRLDAIVFYAIRRYDVIWYMGIAEQGYGHRSGDTAFHPLYPLLGSIVGRILGGDFFLGLWLVSQVCCVAMLTVFYLLVQQHYDATAARRATLLLMCSPLGFAFLLPYTESLLLLGILGALLAGAQRRWLLAGACGAVAALTKQPGAVVVLPLLYLLWQQQAANLRGGRWRGALRGMAGIGLVPLGLAGWVLYRATLGDVSFDWSQPQTLVSALLVTPSYADVWKEYFSWPWVNAGFARDQLLTRPYPYLIINVVIMLALLAIALYAIWRQRGAAAIFAMAIIVLNLSIVYPDWPYMGIVRRFTIIYPIFIQLALWARRRSVLVTLVAIQLPLWLLISSMYLRNAFVP